MIQVNCFHDGGMRCRNESNETVFLAFGSGRIVRVRPYTEFQGTPWVNSCALLLPIPGVLLDQVLSDNERETEG